MQKAKNSVLRRQKALNSNGGDTALQELLIMLADAYEALLQVKGKESEDIEKLLDDVERMLGSRKELMEGVANDLLHHEEALNCLTIRSTLLEGIGLGVNC